VGRGPWAAEAARKGGGAQNEECLEHWVRRVKGPGERERKGERERESPEREREGEGERNRERWGRGFELRRVRGVLKP
jgi:hypothetical protein